MVKPDREPVDDRGTFYFLLGLVLTFLISLRTPVDTDMWWHLRAGEESWDLNAPLTTDLFSYTKYGSDWINHSWLAQVLLYRMFKGGGFVFLCIWLGLMAVICSGFIQAQFSKTGVLSSLIVVYSAIVLTQVWTPRPQLFSLLFISILGYVFYLLKYKDRNLLWSMPLIFLFWVNLHGGFLLGFMVIGLTILGEGLALQQPDRNPNTITKQTILKIIFWTFISILVLFINPNGIDILRVTFNTLNVRALQNHIVEWAAPNFHDPLQQLFLWEFFLFILLVGYFRIKVNTTDMITAIWFAFLAFMARRNIGPFVLVMAPILHRSIRLLEFKNYFPFSQIQKILGKQNINQSMKDKNFHKGLNLAIIGGLFLFSIIRIFWLSNPGSVANKMNSDYPTGAVNYIQLHQLKGRMLSEYNWGGYLIWSLREYPVFLDGRTDLFGDEVIEDWRDIVMAYPGWEEKLITRDIRLVLLTKEKPLNNILYHTGWDLVYQDQISQLFIRSPTQKSCTDN